MARSKKDQDPTDFHHPESDLVVVGIGASAGGIQALSTFFSNVVPDAGIAYVVILHLSPDHDSQLAHVLQQSTKLPVTQVTKETNVVADHVYVVPPDKSLSMGDRSIVVKPIGSVEERRAPVDIFFRTLADTHAANAVGVILSGTGANGSMGIKRIKEMGGVTFAQNPREAEFNEMPRNAVATELIDSILPVAEIPSKIVKYRESVRTIRISEDVLDEAQDQQKALRGVFTQLRLRTGHDFSNYKRPTVLRRIERRIGVRNLPDLQAYDEYLRENPDEAQALLKDLLISVTNFFRDKKAFAALEKVVFPRLTPGASPTKPIRIWVPGCATGEEAYSIAMIAAEMTGGSLESPSVQIFATDIDENAVAIAREGIYSLNDAADVSPERLRHFFNKVGDNYRVRRELREMVLFAPHNVLKDPPFSRLDLVSCRNLLIYLNHTAQERVMETIHFALKPEGYLFVGSSESVDGSGDLFIPVDKENHIYQSRQVTSRPFPVPESVPIYRAVAPIRPENGRRGADGLDRITYSDLHLRLIEEFAPPSVVVNQDHDIVHLSKTAGRFMRVAAGEPTNNLLKLIHPEIRLELRTALFQAGQEGVNIEVKGLKIGTDGHEEFINLLVRPVVSDTDTARGFILVIFEPAGTTTDDPHREYVAPEPFARKLEEELVRSRTQLKSALEQAEVQAEELRASNEELQAMNEELRSSTEELETSKEELQSINEELSTVNQELKVKIEELSHSNNNFQNLLASIDIGVIFLDRSLRVNFFSAAAREIFNLIGNDVGRPLTDITNKLDYGNLASDAEEVLDSLKIVDREVSTKNGRIFLMKMFPYRTAEDRINGVVITFIDITTRKQAEYASAERAKILAGQNEAFQAAMNGKVLANALDPIIRTAYGHFDENSRAAFYVRDENGGLQHLLGMTEEYLQDTKALPNGPENLSWGASSANGNAIITTDITKDPRWKPWRQLAAKHDLRSSWAFPLRPTGGRRLGTLILYFTEPREPTPSDLEIAKSLAQAAAIIISREHEVGERTRSELWLQSITDLVPDLLWNSDADGSVFWCNQRWLEYTGQTLEQATGWGWTEAIHPDEREAAVKVYCQAVGSGGSLRIEQRLRRYDGEYRWFVIGTSPLKSEDSQVETIYGAATDIHESRMALERLGESEERLRLIANSIQDYAILGISIDNRITTWNQGAEKIFGWSADEALGQLGEIIFTDEDRSAGVPAKEISSAIKNGRAPDERYHQRKDGSAFYASGVMTLVRDPDGVIVGFAKILRDMTQTQAAQKAVRERELLQRLISAQEEERTRLARDLHDALGQELTLLRLRLDSMRRAAKDEKLAAKLTDIERIAATVDEGIDRIAWELRPLALADLGLVPALEKYIKEWSAHSGAEAHLVKASFQRVRFRPEVETNLYRIVQEALNNIAKHAAATRVDIVFEKRDGKIILVVEDDGKGFSPTGKRATQGLGLTGMRERAQLIGGSFEIESSRGKGTTIYVNVPLESAVLR